MIYDRFMLKELIFLTCSDLILSGLISVVDSGFDVAASIFLPTLLLTLILSRRSTKDVVMEERFYSCS